MPSRGKRIGRNSAVVDGEVIEVLIVGNVLIADGGGSLLPAACVARIVVAHDVREVAGDTPTGRVVHVGCHESIETQL